MSSNLDARDFRRIMGLFATGVTVVATEIKGEIQGMTANAITSVSLDPLLVLVCIGNQLAMVGYLEESKSFSINILREDQEALSNYFADLWEAEVPPPHRFSPWEAAPRLEDCIASLGCVVHEIFPGGDHRIVVGRVVALHLGEAPYRPLLFYGGQYESLGAAPADSAAN